MNLEKLGSYHIESELGRGGMGVVYRATQTDTGTPVAIKVLPAELARDPGFAERFAREVSTLQKLDHRNIVRLIEPGEDQGYQYYVMEYVAGKGLDKIIAEQRRIPWSRAIDIAIQICHGLKHAHDSGVIHRDLKPANLLITDDGVAKLTDFGIAKVFAGTALTATGGVIGTPEYMSPEQGEGKPITRRTDLYSLGAVLYTMLTGRPPFIGRGVAELINQHRFGQFDRPSMIVPEIPSWLDELVCQLLEKDPEKRPPDAHVVARRLEAVQKKMSMRAAQTILEDEPTVQADVATPRRRRGIGPATLMQRLMRAQLKEMDEPGWLGALFQRTWVLVLALFLAVSTLTVFALSSGESRRWKMIERLAASEDERDLGLLFDRLQDYVRRFPSGPHVEQAREMIPDVEGRRQQREFGRSPLVRDMRPTPGPISELERLYRKSLIELWSAGPLAARATLEQIVAQEGSAGRQQFIVDLAREDLLSLELQQAAQLKAEGHSAEAQSILQRIVADNAGNLKRSRFVRAAREAMAEEQ